MNPIIVLTVSVPQTCSSWSPFSSLAYLKFKEEQVQMIIISGQNQSYFLKQRWMPPGSERLSKKKKIWDRGQSNSILISTECSYFFHCILLQLLLVPTTGLRMLVLLLSLEWPYRNETCFCSNRRRCRSLVALLVSLTKEHRNGLGTKLKAVFLELEKRTTGQVSCKCAHPSSFWEEKDGIQEEENACWVKIKKPPC